VSIPLHAMRNVRRSAVKIRHGSHDMIFQTQGRVARFINFPVLALPLSAGKESHRSNCLAAKAMFSQIDVNI
jgi:hypothetical protein